ncbi:phosphopantothenoylcysteine decarboxylase-like, partial [Glossina fuscipes]|uniref:Phosphopantothenoylcysteine decarboxylase-like n=1 Tax=Glossina fuscipes TaxID=7396 RepID=A0A9C5Z185_9MUSC
MQLLAKKGVFPSVVAPSPRYPQDIIAFYDHVTQSSLKSAIDSKTTGGSKIIIFVRVATIKLPVLIEKLQDPSLDFRFNIKVIFMEHAKHFVDFASVLQSAELFDNEMEWKAWNKRGDPVVNVELGKWADLLVIAPLSANSLAKMLVNFVIQFLSCNSFFLISSLMPLQGLYDNLPLLFCPAMNTRMYDHPITSDQINNLKSWGYYEIPSIVKTLIYGDTGNGAMADVDTIIIEILNK